MCGSFARIKNKNDRDPRLAALIPYLCPATARNISEADAFDDVLTGNWGRGAATAFLCVVAVVVPLLVAPTLVDGARRGGGGGGRCESEGEGVRRVAGVVLVVKAKEGGGVLRSSAEVVGGVATEELDGERGVLRDGAAGAVLLPLRKKFGTLNPGTTIITAVRSLYGRDAVCGS
jgi:hypothetical protein